MSVIIAAAALSVTGADAGAWLSADPPPAALRNVWPEDWEDDYSRRGRRVLAALAARKVNPGNTYFENEKRTYGYLLARAVSGDAAVAEQAVTDLQREDAQAKDWHARTAGIDFYAAFTLKHQTRKYFLLKDRFAPAYRRRMFEGAKAWTEQDPLRRPHPAYEPGKSGWGPDVKNSWVDVRSTDNLWLMRTTSVYLFAEETGNRATTQLYKDRLLAYAAKLYRAGLGEWDSENYLGHDFPPLLNLYDFAKDPEVRGAAKACLDWLSAAGAVKYSRGAFGGPTKRDYNHPQPFGGSAARMLWVWFGDAPAAIAFAEDAAWESDEVHPLTSAYRPPAAVVALARGQFKTPVELFNAKPVYHATTSPESGDPPAYLETLYLSETFKLGSLAGGTPPAGSRGEPGDVGGFKLLVHDDARGAVTVQGAPGPDPLFPGSPIYQPGKVSAENRVGQYGPLAIWLCADGASPWRWVVPDAAAISMKDGVTFLKFERTFVALRPLGCSSLKVDDAGTALVARGEKPRFPDHRVLSATGDGGAFCGVAIEVGEPATHRSFDAFQKAALAAEVDVTELNAGVVRYKTPAGRWLGVHWHDDPHDLGVWRNGVRHDWAEHAAHLYRAADGSASDPIAATWGGGTLTVAAGDRTFRGAVTDDGLFSFENLEDAPAEPPVTCWAAGYLLGSRLFDGVDARSVVLRRRPVQVQDHVRPPPQRRRRRHLPERRQGQSRHQRAEQFRQKNQPIADGSRRVLSAKHQLHGGRPQHPQRVRARHGEQRRGPPTQLGGRLLEQVEPPPQEDQRRHQSGVHRRRPAERARRERGDHAPGHVDRDRSGEAEKPPAPAALPGGQRSGHPVAPGAGRSTRQGLPAAITPAGTSFVTTLPAPITEPAPTVTPGHRIAPPPIQTSSPIVTGAADSSPRARVVTSSGWVAA